MNNPIRIKFRDDGSVFETLLLEDRPVIGPELRQYDAPYCQSGPSVPVDVPYKHCKSCEMSIAGQIGLTDSEMDRIIRWREAASMTPDERKQEKMTGAEIGAILDKIAAKLDDCNTMCDAESHRIVVEVDTTP